MARKQNDSPDTPEVEAVEAPVEAAPPLEETGASRATTDVERANAQYPTPGANPPVPCRVKIEFGSRRQHQTHDIQPHETCADLIKTVGLKPGEYQILASSHGDALPNEELAIGHFRPTHVVHVVRNPAFAGKKSAVPTEPVISGSGL